MPYESPLTQGELLHVVRYPNGGEVWFRHGQPPYLVRYANGDQVFLSDGKVFMVVAHNGRVHVRGMADALIKGKS